MSLSEREQRLLEEIEQSLMAGDPHVPPTGWMARVAAAAIAAIVGLAFLIFGLVTGAVLGTVIATAGLVLIVVGCCEVGTCRRR